MGQDRTKGRGGRARKGGRTLKGGGKKLKGLKRGKGGSAKKQKTKGEEETETNAAWGKWGKTVTPEWLKTKNKKKQIGKLLQGGKT